MLPIGIFQKSNISHSFDSIFSLENLLSNLKRNWTTLLFFVAVAVYVISVTILHSPATSPIDEWVYLDYLYKIPEQGIVFKGEFVDQRVLELLSCHGTNPFGPIGTKCGFFPILSDYPNGAVTSADPYTPLYFYTVFGIGALLHFVFEIPQLLAWRLSGSVWLFATFIVLWRLFRAWNVSRFTRIVLGLLLLGSPFVWWTYTYVSTDSSAIFFGAILMLLATRIVNSQTGFLAFYVATIVATLFKLTNLIGVASATAFILISLIVRYISQRELVNLKLFISRNKKTLLVCLASIISAPVSQIVWLKIHDYLAVSLATANQGASHPFTIEEIFVQLTNFLPGTITSGAIDAYIPGFVYAPLSWITVSGVLGAAFVTARGSANFPLVLSVVLGAFLAAPLLGIALTLVTQSYFQLPARYGAVLLPGFLVVTGLLISSAWSRVVLFFYSLSILGLGIWLSIFLSQLAP